MAEQPGAIDPHVALLYREHHGWLVALLRRHLGNSDSAADLAHDTFVRLMTQRADTSAARLQEPRAYLTVVARTLMADHWRRRAVERAYQQALADLPPTYAPSPEVRLHVLQTVAQLDAMLGALPARVGRVFRMAQVDGLPASQIAQQLGVSVATIERDLARALRQCYAIRYGD